MKWLDSLVHLKESPFYFVHIINFFNIATNFQDEQRLKLLKLDFLFRIIYPYLFNNSICTIFLN